MIAELARLLADWIQFLWPFRIVKQWERGGYYICGRFWREVGPGFPWPVIPWFMEVITTPIAKAIVGTPRLDITLRDGSTLSFAASATCRVVDFDKAMNSVDDVRETMQELLAAVLAEKLSEVDADRLDPERRGRLLATLRGAVASAAAEFGVEVSELRFTTFVLNVRTFRLLQDTGTVAEW